MTYFLSFFFQEYILHTILICELFLIWDMILSAFGIQGLYYLFHAIHNIIIGWKTYRNVYSAILMDEKTDQSIDPLVFPVVYALHIYHIIKYSHYISFDEFMHHLLCLIVAIPLVCFNFENRDLLGFSLFASTGWSTVFHYFSLFLYKNNFMSKRKTLRYNFITNTFFRSPLILFNSAFLLQYTIQKQNISLKEIYLSFILFSILITNALYFQYKITNKYFESIMVHHHV